MTRKPSLPKPLKSFVEVDQNLSAIADLNRRIELEQSACNEQVDKLKVASNLILQPLLDDLTKREALIEEYCKLNIDQFQDVKTKKLTHGSVGFRESTSVTIADPEHTIVQLRKLRLAQCIRTSYAPDKDQIKQLTAKRLEKIGAVVIKQDNFSYKVAKVTVTSEA